MIFNPTLVKSISDLIFLTKSDAGTVWLYQVSTDKESLSEDMMLNKLIANPKLLDDSTDNYTILRFTGKERLGTFLKLMPVRKFVLLGVQPSAAGIHFPLQPYQPVVHNGIAFLSVDAPEKMPEMSPQQKTLLAQVLKSFKEI
jgi:hypothetical protein